MLLSGVLIEAKIRNRSKRTLYFEVSRSRNELVELVCEIVSNFCSTSHMSCSNASRLFISSMIQLRMQLSPSSGLLTE